MGSQRSQRNNHVLQWGTPKTRHEAIAVALLVTAKVPTYFPIFKPRESAWIVEAGGLQESIESQRVGHD